MYLADDQDGVFADEGDLWAFRVTAKNGVPVNPADPFNGANDYNDVQPGDDFAGEFIPVPEDIAKGTTAELPQDALENWSNDNNVFQFVRAEDIAYDKNDPSVVYMADTGGSEIQPDPDTGRLHRVDRRSVRLAERGHLPLRLQRRRSEGRRQLLEVRPGRRRHDGCLRPVQEPGQPGHEQEEPHGPGGHRRRQGLAAPLPPGHLAPGGHRERPDGESSGIVDVSEWFGGGTWLLDVQGHGVNVDESFDPETGCHVQARIRPADADEDPGFLIG